MEEDIESLVNKITEILKEFLKIIKKDKRR
ncbi:hypothetical protein QOZ93_000194 [Hathewaya limosa]|uniref:Uncharacterized protein n=1 Tax=Hathewaya limosa TaxID=1536 RepID=A0ABU0JQP2_HATLI|nr:hypothetical protein [Hathewaya limosa]